MSQRSIKTKRQQTADEVLPRTAIRDLLWHALDFAIGKTEDFRIVFLQTDDKCLYRHGTPLRAFLGFLCSRLRMLG